MNNSILEIACFNLESAIIAAKAGASRIEFCEDYSIGGVTPSYEDILKVKAQVNIPMFVMIRPRGGNFIYTEEEFEEMKKQIEWCQQNKIDGVVFGILTADNKVDETRCKILVQLAQPMSCTFHRAFDEVEIVADALEIVIGCGFDRILNSGQKPTAIEGAANIHRLMEQASKRIVMIPGGGVRPDNISELKNITGATEFHSAALKKYQKVADRNIIQALLQRLD